MKPIIGITSATDWKKNREFALIKQHPHFIDLFKTYVKACNKIRKSQ